MPVRVRVSVVALLYRTHPSVAAVVVLRYSRRRQLNKLCKDNVGVVVGVLVASKRIPPFLPHKLKLPRPVYVDVVFGVLAASETCNAKEHTCVVDSPSH